VDSIDKRLDHPAGLKVLVMGLARSGSAAARLLTGRGARVLGTDRGESISGASDLERAGVELRLGGDHPELVPQAEMLVLSPGVPLSAPLPQEALRLGVPVLGELELAARLLRLESGPPLLAVTGTNGKSTSSALSAHILLGDGRRVFLGGNIGKPLCELLLSGQTVDVAVVEVSSFQLEHLSDPRAFVPRVAVWLNLTPDHLDRHASLQNYAAIKRRLFEGLGPTDSAVLFTDDATVRESGLGLRGRLLGFGRDAAELPDSGMLISGRELSVIGEAASGTHYTLTAPRLAGDHNAENAAAAALATAALGVAPAAIQAGLDSYPGLPHRLEPVGEIAGVRYINDSKGTNVDATAKSLTGFDTPIILLAGGRGKGSGYRKLRAAVDRHVKQLILFGEEADRLAVDLEGCAPVQLVAGMAEAVNLARELAQSGDVVLLSPACASFDMFRDFAHRGRVFTELVSALREGS